MVFPTQMVYHVIIFSINVSRIYYFLYQSSELQNVGYDSVGVVVKANTNVCSHFGSIVGRKVLEQGSTYLDFLSYVNGEYLILKMC